MTLELYTLWCKSFRMYTRIMYEDAICRGLVLITGFVSIVPHWATRNDVDKSITPWWRHQMETFSALLALCAGNSVSLIFAWINVWAKNREAGDLRRHRAHYDVTVMTYHISEIKTRIIRKKSWRKSEYSRQASYQYDLISRLCWQNESFRAGIINYMPLITVGCNYWCMSLMTVGYKPSYIAVYVTLKIFNFC